MNVPFPFEVEHWKIDDLASTYRQVDVSLDQYRKSTNAKKQECLSAQSFNNIAN